MNSKKGNNSTIHPHVPYNLDLGLIFMLIRSNFVSLPCKILSGSEFTPGLDYFRWLTLSVAQNFIPGQDYSKLLLMTWVLSSPCCSQSWLDVCSAASLQAYPVKLSASALITFCLLNMLSRCVWSFLLSNSKNRLRRLYGKRKSNRQIVRHR